MVFPIVHGGIYDSCDWITPLRYTASCNSVSVKGQPLYSSEARTKAFFFPDPDSPPPLASSKNPKESSSLLSGSHDWSLPVKSFAPPSKLGGGDRHLFVRSSAESRVPLSKLSGDHPLTKSAAFDSVCPLFSTFSWPAGPCDGAILRSFVRIAHAAGNCG